MTLAEQLATLLEQGQDQPRHRVVAATELRRLRAELAALREQEAVAQPTDDPMDWPLPCDVKVGHGTHARGTKLRSLVARMQAIYDTVQASQAVAQPLTDEQTRADAARWREMRRVFHVTEHIGKTTGMPATKLSCHWHGWASGDHADVTGCVDALIYERAHGIGQPAEDTK